MSIYNLCDMSEPRKYRVVYPNSATGSMDFINDNKPLVYSMVMKYCDEIDQTILNSAMKSMKWDSYMTNEKIDFESLTRDLATLSNYDPLFNDIAEFFKFVKIHSESLQSIVDTVKDFTLEYTALNLFYESYLLRTHDKRLIERPLYLYLRTAVFINLRSKRNIISNISTTFQMLVDRVMTFASPVLYNSGTVKSQIASCFLMSLKSNEEKGIRETLDNALRIAKATG
ncbi:5364_t:CDS:2, partial [Dentiscutata heterogama]